MNLVIFASDNKALSSLNGIVNEASQRGINLFVMVSHNTQLMHPIRNKDQFEILTNCETTDPHYCESLGVTLPFKPDWLLVARERWDPELSIILEFKKRFNGCKVGLVEPNSWIIGFAETRLESVSRNRFKDLIDAFFIHSTHSKTIQQIQGFEGNMVVTGNPKYDINLNPEQGVIDHIKNTYKIDSNKKQVLLFSLVSSKRKELYKLFKQYVEQNPQYQFFLKPFPGEPFLNQFRSDYYPNFCLEGVTPILNESDVWPMFNICDIHVGTISSIFHASLLLKKEIVDFTKELKIPSFIFEQRDHILNSNNIGIEDSKELWLRSLNINEDQLRDLISNDTLKNISQFNNNVWESLDNPEKLLILFDDFNDNKSSNRILDYITTYER